MAHSYAIPDLHGRHDLLLTALDAVSARAVGAPLTLVVLGDYVDKGPESRQVIEALIDLEGRPPPGWDVICLKGNHDAMMVDAVQRGDGLDDWLAKGGDTALRSYGASRPDDIRVVPRQHIDWLDQRPLTHIDRHRVFVHAGIDNGLPLERQAERTLLWKRYPDDVTAGYGDRHVVHGHDRRRDGPLLLAGRSNLDTMAWSTGRLVIGVFDDELAGGPIDLIELQGPATKADSD